MSTDEKYKIYVDLLSKAKGKEGLDIVLLRKEIRKELISDYKAFGKFLELVASFQEIIPDEKQRYKAAIKALSAISGLNRQNVLESAYNQLPELKKIEKVVLTALTGFNEEVREMDSRLKKNKSDLAKLREKITELEKEEQEILGSMAALEKMRKISGQGARKVFTDLGAEINEIRKKIEEFSSEEIASHSVVPADSIESNKPEDVKIEEIKDKMVSSPQIAPADSVEIAIPECIGAVTKEKKVSSLPSMPVDSIESNKRENVNKEISEIEEILINSELQATEGTRKCPVCGDQLNFNNYEAVWKCYSCGHQQVQTDDDVIDAIEEQIETMVASEPQSAEGARKCPMCGGHMDFHSKESIWKCYSCGNEDSQSADY